MDPALANFRKVIKDVSDPPVRALANDRGSACEALRFFSTPYFPLAKGERPLKESTGGGPSGNGSHA